MTFSTKDSETKSSKSLDRYSVGLLSIYTCIITYLAIYNKTFWYDEAYSMAIIQQSVPNIWNITSTDVHPPLYYLLLKGFSILFGNNLIALHLFSSLGVISCMLFAIIKIRKLFGEKVSFTFILLLSIMPVSQYLGIEIRMYSWIMFFVLLTSVYAYQASETNKFNDFFKFTVFAICTVYIHNYGLIVVGSIYIYLIISNFRQKENTTYTLLSLLIFLLAYGFWMPHLVNQIVEVHKDFWIEPLTVKDLLLFSYYFFSPKEPSHPYLIFSKETMSIFLSISLLAILIVSVFIGLYILKTRDSKTQAANYFIYVFGFTIIAALTVSFIFRPIIVARFTNCVLTPLLLAISLYLNIVWGKNKIIRYAGKFLLIVLLLSTVTRFFSELKYFKIKNKEKEELQQFVELGDNNQSFIASSAYYPELAKLSLLFPKNKFYLYSPNDITSYLPFRIITVDTIPDNKCYLWIASSENNYHIDIVDIEMKNDIEEKYSAESNIKTSDIQLIQLRKNNIHGVPIVQTE